MIGLLSVAVCLSAIVIAVAIDHVADALHNVAAAIRFLK